MSFKFFRFTYPPPNEPFANHRMIPRLHQIMFTFAQIRVEATKQTLKYFSSADDSDFCILIELKCRL